MPDYDEFALLAENASEMGLISTSQTAEDFTAPRVQRLDTEVADGQSVSALAWRAGDSPPNLVFLHGGGQNAHTWDNILVALDQPALAVDLPGHGHSDWRPDQDYSPQLNAIAVAEVLRRRAQPPVLLVGMSMGGLTSISLTAAYPELVRALVLVDVSPNSGVRSTEMSPAQKGSVALVSGPPSFESFEAMFAAASAASPTREPTALRRGLRHNAREMPDGTWRWRYDHLRNAPVNDSLAELGWQELASIQVPITLVRGGDSAFVAEADVERMQTVRPELRVEVVAGSGHSVQSDRPQELLALVQRFIAEQA
ncbi:MAG: hydrolase [Frankiales bacterium]|nr:hydrolase [Frankiales bacterium]